MLRPRIIPVLLLLDRGLVKSLRFSDFKYIGDPINTVHILNEKEVDELVVLDIAATKTGRGPDIAYVETLVGECFMPFAYGGGVRTIEQMRRLFKAGVEKVCLNSAAAADPAFVTRAAEVAGSQSVVVSMDVRRDPSDGTPGVWTACGTRPLGLNPVEYARDMERRGAGEILLTSVDRDGTLSGYDLDLVRDVSQAVNIPVIACGGAASLRQMAEVIGSAGAAAAAAGSHFVFCGSREAILITYPDRQDMDWIAGRVSACNTISTETRA